MIGDAHFSCSKIQLSREALTTNLNLLREHIKGRTRVSMVIKGNAYGHGIEQVVPMAEEAGIRHFSVSSADEAYRAWKSGSADSEIMITAAIPNEAFEWAIQNDISFFLYDEDRLGMILEVARKLSHPARVHLEIETGMNRTGLDEEELARVVEVVSQNPDSIRIAGTCTHLAGAESIANHLRIRGQLKRFRAACGSIREAGLKPGLRHVASSSAALTMPEASMDLVRAGIVLYGFWPSQEIRTHCMMLTNPEGDLTDFNPLVRMMRWQTQVLSLKEVHPGDFVGYGVSFQVPRPMKLASIPIGYYHGFSRGLSNLGYVLVGGRRATVVGLVNMNMMMVDVSHCGHVHPGDEVVIIGRQGSQEISVAAFSDLSRLLSYEFLSRISAEIPREIVD